MNAQQLKNSILQMAVSGKLVPQDPEDEPAALLLERIRAEKEELIRSGKIKREKNPSAIFRGPDGNFYEKISGREPVNITDELPFDIPDSWEWARVKTIARVLGGKRIPAGRKLTTENTGHIYIRVADMKNHSVNTTGLLYVPEDIFPTISKYIITKHDLYITVAGTIGNVGKIPAILDGSNLTENADRLVFSHLNQDWFLFCLSSPHVKNQITDATTKVGQPKLAIVRIEELLIPVPPVEEQARIVCRIKNVFPYIDKYEKHEYPLEKLNTQFPEQLKKSILQQAVQGKLVPQDPTEEPAGVLLERIRGEKERLIAEGKIKRDKNESVIFKRDNSWYEKRGSTERCIDDELPFDIPDSWEWVRLENICEIARGGSPRPIKDFLTESPDGVNWIKISDSDKGGKYINSTKEKIKPEGIRKSRFVHAGDFLLTNSMSFGRPYILNVDGCIHDGWLVLSGYQIAYDKDFLYYMLSSSFAYNQFCDVVSGAVVKNLNSDKVATSLFPLPPLSEQQRIVEKIEALMPMINAL